MQSEDDPYEILGLDPATATESQVKSAYRKAALRNHPDKQRTEQDRLHATTAFTKISNAYELLTDPVQKKQYDDHRLMRQQQQSDAEWFYSNDRLHPHGFHDPFQLFEQVFREEFGHPFASHHRSAAARTHRDPFFGDRLYDPFSGSSWFGGSLFDSFDAPFGRQGRRDPFEDMRRMQHDMMKQMHSLEQQQQQQSTDGRRVFYSSSSSSNTSGRNGESVTTTTTTRMINGKQQTVKERVVRKADGTTERHVDTSGDEDFPVLEESSSSSSFPFGYLQQQQQHHQEALPAPSEPEQRDNVIRRPSKRRWFGR